MKRVATTRRTTSRRTFLRETLTGAALLSAAKLLPFESLLAGEYQGVPNGLLFFSPKEYQIFEAVTDRLIGSPGTGNPGSRDVGVAVRADKFLAGANPEVGEQFHQLLSVFNAPLFTFLFDFRTSSFLNMAPKDQDSYLEDWMTSVLGFRRTGFQALKRVSMSMFYTDKASWQAIGYDGMFMPGDRK